MIKKNDKIKLDELKRENFSLVLSGGSALGFAHLGVLEFMFENNLKPKEIVGTSMGAIIGAAFACGKSFDIINEILVDSNLLNLTSISFKKLSIISSKKIEKNLIRLFGDIKFSNLDVDLKIVATELNTGNIEIFSNKNNSDLKVLDAVLASIALPVIFPPKKIGNNFYVDGYLSSNYSIEVASNNLILGVDVIAKKDLSSFKVDNSFFFSKFKTLFKIYDRSFFHQIKQQSKFKVNNLNSKIKLISIEPDLNKYKSFDYKKVDEIKEFGYLEIVKYFNKLK